MLKEKMEKALNEQINEELYSSYLYLSMSAHFQDINLPGFANWMRAQAQEELMHAMKFYDYIMERRGKVLLKQIKTPDYTWESPLAAFEAALKHEEYITDRINNLVEISIKEKDHASHIFLEWFVTEQVEEEASVDDIINRLKLVGASKGGMFMIDRELGKRGFTASSTGDE
ncbi:MAG TPA: ferritin [Candidatus Eremiobacteraeota bacterium]|nr:MAG: Ferritin [bacterium ADurb.Bin363]HPZ10244.1 ferritin [Candidatus Eremiobacteraeota bacterium]